uniref:Uncharacterized protein n=1 Tax=Panagrolaimus superbus TaxID=310955 RepID=A0A914YNS5_9BILA
MKIAADNYNLTYPNIVTVSNFEDWSLNSSLYYRTSQIWFAYGDFWGTPLNYIECDYFNETCVVSLPNAQISPLFYLHYINGDTKVLNGNTMFFNDGIFLSGDKGFLLNKKNPCGSGILSYGYVTVNNTVKMLRKNETMCCIEYDNVEIPDQNDSQSGLVGR